MAAAASAFGAVTLASVLPAMSVSVAVKTCSNFSGGLPSFLKFSIPSPSSTCSRNVKTRRTFFKIARAKTKGEEDQRSKNADEDGKEEEFFNPLSFVTNNPSSRDAIQLPAVPAEDGNVGEMIYRIEDKGREYGSYVQVGDFKWFVRETGSSCAECGTIVFLHGAPTQSYSYRNVMAQAVRLQICWLVAIPLLASTMMGDSGYHCYAPDWLGFGFSEKPEPGYEFAYTEEAYHEELDKLLTELSVNSPFHLVTQGFVLGSYGLTWCLKNPDRISRLVILNTPLTTNAPVPNLFWQLRFPLLGEFTCQNAIMAERFVEAGSPYVLKSEKADVYRLPYLSSSGPGFALLEATRKASFKNLLSQIENGFSFSRWNIPTLVTWGVLDKYLPRSEAEMFQKNNVNTIQINMVEGAGHMPQEDWPDKVVDSIKRFLQ